MKIRISCFALAVCFSAPAVVTSSAGIFEDGEAELGWGFEKEDWTKGNGSGDSRDGKDAFKRSSEEGHAKAWGKDGGEKESFEKGRGNSKRGEGDRGDKGGLGEDRPGGDQSFRDKPESDKGGGDRGRGEGSEEGYDKGRQGDGGERGKGDDGELSDRREDGRRSFRTTRGKEYRDCEVLDRDDYGVTFRHADGIARLGFEDLPGHVRSEYGYDREKATKFVESYRPKPVKHKPVQVIIPPSNTVRAGASAAYPQYRYQNPYYNGVVYNPAAYGAQFGGFIQPYFAGSFGNPHLVTKIPNGFFAPNHLRVGARPLVDSPVAPSMTSYSQVRDARAAAVKAAVRATPISPAIRVGGGHMRVGGGRK